MIEEIERAKFDVASALSLLGNDPPLGPPSELKVTDAHLEVLEQCVDLTTFERSSVRIRSDISSAVRQRRTANLGTDALELKPGGFIFLGGSGVNIQLVDPKVSREFAFKTPRMSVMAYERNGKCLEKDALRRAFEVEVKAFENERHISRLLSHQNVAQHYFGSFERLAIEASTDIRLPFSLTEWIDGARRLDEYLLRNNLGLREILDLFEQSFAALAHLSDQGVMHWDIKTENVLVSRAGQLKVIDFGNAKLLAVERGDSDKFVTTTKGKYPPIRQFKTTEEGHDDSRRFSIELPDLTWKHSFVDLWMMAREWQRCLGVSTSFRVTLSDAEEAAAEPLQHLAARLSGERSSRAVEMRDCLRVILDRLLCPFAEAHIARFVSEKGAFTPGDIYYSNAHDVLAEVARIEPLFGAGQRFPELMVSLDEVVRLPVTGNSVFTPRIERLVNSALVRPTMLHFQLAQVRQVFPGATHSRFEHLLGTLTTAAYYLRSLYLSDSNAYWRVSAKPVDLRAVLIAAVLHDSGHLAFGHFIEEMSDLMKEVRHTQFVRELLLSARERLTGAKKQPRKTLFSIAAKDVDQFVMLLRGDWCNEEGRVGTDIECVALLDRLDAIFSPAQEDLKPLAYLSSIQSRVAMDGVLHSIIDGPMDADKLDYLRRDSLHAGVFCSSGIDIERFFESLRVCVDTNGATEDPVAAVGVSEKGIAPLETIITARYHLFSSVYWHRTVRCITATLQRVLAEIALRCDTTEEWEKFLAEMLKVFRLRDDKEALEWLRGYLRTRGWLRQKIGSGGASETTFDDLMLALLGDRARYFGQAFELSYTGPVVRRDGDAVTARERVYDELRAVAEGTAIPAKKLRDRDSKSASEPVPPHQVQRRQMIKFQEELAHSFQLAVSKHTNQDFQLDTIMIDIPEPGKDQIRHLIVDRRNKRTRLGPDGHSMKFERIDVLPDFVDVVAVSPVAASLKDVFSRWARKVRIFMSPRDLARLAELGFEAGDISNAWLSVLFERYKLDPEAPMMRFA